MNRSNRYNRVLVSFDQLQNWYEWEIPFPKIWRRKKTLEQNNFGTLKNKFVIIFGGKKWMCFTGIKILHWACEKKLSIFLWFQRTATTRWKRDSIIYLFFHFIILTNCSLYFEFANHIFFCFIACRFVAILKYEFSGTKSFRWKLQSLYSQKDISSYYLIDRNLFFSF